MTERVFLGRGFNAGFLRSALLLGGVANHANFAIQLKQARFDLAQPGARLFTGLLGFLHCLLNRGAAVAEYAGQILAGGPHNHTGDQYEIQHQAQPV